MKTTRFKLALGMVSATLVLMVAPAATAASAAPIATGTVITTASTAFGTALVVGSGQYAGFSLYMITSDNGTTFGCTATPITGPNGNELCAGQSDDTNAEWPAITTVGAPIAGPGVSQGLLGTVTRTFEGVGGAGPVTQQQITYAGHPLYLFDQGPGQVTGEGWDEPSMPPWQGVWSLISPSGLALPWVGTLTTTTIDDQTVLATPMLTGVGWVDFPVYSYSNDSPWSSTCTGSCAIVWPAMLTSGHPGVSGGVSPGAVGTLNTPAGTQVSYNGQPLYLYGDEGAMKTAAGVPEATGSGNGLTFAGGTFSLIPVPAAGGQADLPGDTSGPVTGTGTVITAASTPFGTALVVGSGPYAGYSIYSISSDLGTNFGCTATPATLPFGLGTDLCAGQSDDTNAEWPAITTVGAPIAGPGVSQGLLGTVTRTFEGVGGAGPVTQQQITYAGHPLYLFDQAPFQVTGEGWDEPSLPPWLGVWNLVAPSGQYLPWAGTLTTTTIDGQTVLATPMLTLAGWFDFPVYSYSNDAPWSSVCTGSCAIVWPAMLTSGHPGVSGGVSPGAVGTLNTPAGTQVSYHGQPLYLYGDEGITDAGTFAVTGSGNGLTFAGGTFALVTP
jgi:predicted lipoprotein with Yx(FWY)xxD motif